MSIFFLASVCYALQINGGARNILRSRMSNNSAVVFTMSTTAGGYGAFAFDPTSDAAAHNGMEVYIFWYNGSQPLIVTGISTVPGVITADRTPAVTITGWNYTAANTNLTITFNRPLTLPGKLDLRNNVKVFWSFHGSAKPTPTATADYNFVTHSTKIASTSVLLANFFTDQNNPTWPPAPTTPTTSTSTPTLPPPLPNHLLYQVTPTYRLEVLYSNTTQKVDFTLTTVSTGWVGFALDTNLNNGAHQNMETYILKLGGAPTFATGTSKAYGIIVEDTTALSVARITSVGGVTTAVVTRNISVPNRFTIPNGPIRLFGAENPSSPYPATHTVRRVLDTSSLLSVPLPTPTQSGAPPDYLFSQVTPTFTFLGLYEPSDRKLRFTLTTTSTGWVGFALDVNSGNNAHVNMETYIVRLDGTPSFFTGISQREGVITSDPSPSALASISTVNGNTTIVITRDLAVSNKFTIPDALIRVFVAESAQNPYPATHSQRRSLGTYNFLSGGGEAEKEYGMTSGYVLLLVVFPLLALWVVVRYSLRLFKKSASGSGSLALPSPNPDPMDYQPALGESVFEASKPSGSPPLPKSRGNPSMLKIQGVLGQHLGSSHITGGFLLSGFLYIVLNVICLVYKKDHIKDWKEAGTSIGTLAAANVFLLSLPIARNGMLAWFLGFEVDRVIVFHRWLARFAILLVVIHALTYWPYYKGTYWTEKVFGEREIVFGFVAGVTAVIIFFSSLEVIRRRHFNIFRRFHLLFFVFYVFGALHSVPNTILLSLAGATWIVDRIIRCVWARTGKQAKVALKPGNLVRLRIEKDSLAISLNRYRAGQYVFINVPEVSVLEWHPFSVSSGPRENSLEINVRALGDYTRKLLAVSQMHQDSNSPLMVRVDGPYGNLRLNHRRYPSLVLVAGGIGVTPVIGLVRDLFSVGEINDKSAVPSVIEDVYMLWVIRKEEEYSWFADDLAQCYAKQGQAGFPRLHLRIFVTQNGGPVRAGFHTSRPDFDTLLQQLSNQPTLVFACGPRPMVNSCWDASSKQRRQGRRFDFHHETFEF